MRHQAPTRHPRGITSPGIARNWATIAVLAADSLWQAAVAAAVNADRQEFSDPLRALLSPPYVDQEGHGDWRLYTSASLLRSWPEPRPGKSSVASQLRGYSARPYSGHFMVRSRLPRGGQGRCSILQVTTRNPLLFTPDSGLTSLGRGTWYASRKDERLPFPAKW
jgi:hypothetical protein